MQGRPLHLTALIKLLSPPSLFCHAWLNVIGSETLAPQNHHAPSFLFVSETLPPESPPQSPTLPSCLAGPITVAVSAIFTTYTCVVPHFLCSLSTAAPRLDPPPHTLPAGLRHRGRHDLPLPLRLAAREAGGGRRGQGVFRRYAQ